MRQMGFEEFAQRTGVQVKTCAHMHGRPNNFAQTVIRNRKRTGLDHGLVAMNRSFDL